MRKKFWIILITLIVIVVIIAVVGIITQWKNSKTVKEPSVITTTASPEAMAQLEAAPITAPVVIQNFAFNPPVIKIKKGDSIVWTNRDSVAHTATLNDNSQSTPLIQAGQSAISKFDQAGTFNYHCQPHPWLKGQIIVSE